MCNHHVLRSNMRPGDPQRRLLQRQLHSSTWQAELHKSLPHPDLGHWLLLQPAVHRRRLCARYERSDAM